MSWTRPTKNEVDRAATLLGKPQHRRYFFEKLENPLWVGPLAERGFFKEAPAPVSDAEQSLISFPIWPEARYLSRVAGKNPRETYEVIIEIDTTNVQVQADLIDAMALLPKQFALPLARKIAKWLDGPHGPLHPESHAQFCVRLAQIGAHDVALELFGQLLKIAPDPRARNKGVGTYDTLVPRTRVDRHNYEDVLEEFAPQMARIVGEGLLWLLCDLLSTAIKYSHRGSKPPDDWSFVWRPAIENDPQNLGHSLEDALATAIRDVALTLVGASQRRLVELFTRLQAQPYYIHHRIGLHLLAQCKHPPMAFLSEQGRRTELFEDVDLRHEYLQVLKAHFRKLSMADRSLIVRWVLDRPMEQMLLERAQERGEIQPTEVELKQRAAYWRAQQLLPIQSFLSSTYQHELNRILQDTPVRPEHPEFLSYTSAWAEGPTSPTTMDDLQSMDVGDLVSLLRVWEPPSDRTTINAPSRLGLARQLKEVVTKRPLEILTAADEFRGLDPTYVRALVEGMTEILSKVQTLPWSTILSLAKWVIEQVNGASARATRHDRADPDWNWTRMAIARLLSQSFEKDVLPFEHRFDAWAVLEPLTEDTEPTPEYEREYGGSNMDPMAMSTNTVRGEAMHTAIKYALWVRRNLEKQGAASTSFATEPEVAAVLNKHLDPNHDPSLTVRAVYGDRLSWLHFLDREWTRTHMGAIFPHEAGNTARLDAAWDAYVRYSHPYDDMLPLIQDEYDNAVGRLQQRDEPRDADRRLAEHIMVYYGRGQLTLDWVINRFFSRSPGKVRGAAIEFVGRTVEHESSLPEEVLERLKRMWEGRLQTGQQASDRGAFGDELAQFGHWLLARHFGEEWCLRQLEVVAEVYGAIDPEYLVFERLAELCQRFPDLVIRCVRLIVSGWTQPWSMYGVENHLRVILEQIKTSGSATARREANGVINLLGERGQLGFRDLLN